VKEKKHQNTNVKKHTKKSEKNKQTKRRAEIFFKLRKVGTGKKHTKIDVIIKILFPIC
jgi:hypothetical protein